MMAVYTPAARIQTLNDAAASTARQQRAEPSPLGDEEHERHQGCEPVRPAKLAGIQGLAPLVHGAGVDRQRVDGQTSVRRRRAAGTARRAARSTAGTSGCTDVAASISVAEMPASDAVGDRVPRGEARRPRTRPAAPSASRAAPAPDGVGQRPSRRASR